MADTNKSDANKSEANRPDANRAGANRPDANRAEANRSEANRQDASRADAPQGDDGQKTLENQIAELRREITKINKTIAARGAELMDNASEQASDLYDTAAARASRTAQQLRTQAQAVSDVARENPGTATALVGMIGLLGLLAGLAIGQATNDTSRRWY